jgi:hypothetical protein
MLAWRLLSFFGVFGVALQYTNWNWRSYDPVCSWPIGVTGEKGLACSGRACKEFVARAGIIV